MRTQIFCFRSPRRDHGLHARAADFSGAAMTVNALGVCILVACVSCASGTRPTPSADPSGQNCQSMPLPRDSTAIVPLLNANALQGAMRGLPAARVIVSLHREESNGALNFAVLDSSGLDAEANAKVRDAIQSSSLLEQLKPPWAFRLTVGDQGQAMAFAPSESCAPVPVASPAAATATRRAILSAEDLRDMQARGPFRVRVLVGPRGEVVRSELSLSSGSRVQDAMALEAAGRRRFLPARIDGIATPAWFEIASH
jgi:TonB family protein